jgi:EAL domain-containing protein (putative c-di-GMP-specific phosphodiesterase class I)
MADRTAQPPARAVPRDDVLEAEADAIKGFVDRAELPLAFQPVFGLAGGECVAVEALARFPSETGLGTAAWFDRADELGLRLELELAAVRSALDHLDELPANVLLSVNVSPDTILSPEFAALVEPVADRLIVEITEHAPVADYAALTAALAPLRERGTRIAIDDVGAGFASFRHILLLAPDIVKLDFSLTHRIETDSTRRALASALVDFGAGAGATIVAEGIETEDELELLRALGIDQGQGYHLGRPAPLSGRLH